MEGEELPIDMLGPRTKRKHLNLHWPHLPHLPAFVSRGSTSQASGAFWDDDWCLCFCMRLAAAAAP